MGTSLQGKLGAYDLETWETPKKEQLYYLGPHPSWACRCFWEATIHCWHLESLDVTLIQPLPPPAERMTPLPLAYR